MSTRLEAKRHEAMARIEQVRAVEDTALRLGAELRDIQAHKRANMDQIETLVARKPDGVSVVRLARCLKLPRQTVYRIKKRVR